MLAQTVVATTLLVAGALHLVPSDAGSGGDAPDACDPGVAAIELELNVEYFGFFTFVDDTSDHYGFIIPQAGLAEIVMQPSPALASSTGRIPFQMPLPLPDYDLRLNNGACGPMNESSADGNAQERLIVFLEAGLYDLDVFVPPPLTGERDTSALYCDPFCILEGYGIEVHFPPQ